MDSVLSTGKAAGGDGLALNELVRDLAAARETAALVRVTRGAAPPRPARQTRSATCTAISGVAPGGGQAIACTSGQMGSLEKRLVRSSVGQVRPVLVRSCFQIRVWDLLPGGGSKGADDSTWSAVEALHGRGKGCALPGTAWTVAAQRILCSNKDTS